MNDFLTCFPSYNVPVPRPLRNENIASFFIQIILLLQ